jgi:hypothetical protein
MSKSNGYLADPSKPDPRYAIFPSQYPPAISRCCAGKLTNPLDIVPPSCRAKSAVYEHVLPNPKAHEIDPISMGFEKQSTAQQAITRASDSLPSRPDGSTMKGRLMLWESEASKIPISKFEKFRMMSLHGAEVLVLPIGRRELNFF